MNVEKFPVEEPYVRGGLDPDYSKFIPSEEKRIFINEAIEKEFRKISENEITGNIIWHYTSIQNFISIVESRELWASHISGLNDSKEFYYFIKLVEDKILRDKYQYKILVERFFRRFSCGERSKTDLGAFQHLIGASSVIEDISESINDNMNLFVASFSSEKDSLPQWRGYSGGSGGIAIGFDVSDLISKNPEFNFVKVMYDNGSQEKIANSISKSFFKSLIHGYALDSERAGFSGFTPYSWLGYIKKFWISQLTSLSLATKHKSFKDEAEWRFISKFGSQNNKFKFRQNGSILTRHKTLTLGNNEEKNSIKKIMVGPSKHAKITKENIYLLMKQNNYKIKEEEIQITEIPYQTF